MLVSQRTCACHPRHDDLGEEFFVVHNDGMTTTSRCSSRLAECLWQLPLLSPCAVSDVFTWQKMNCSLTALHLLMYLSCGFCRRVAGWR